MTSLEIAELTGKQHKNLMRDIRNMEPAWEKVHGLKFELIDYKDRLGRIKPCYSLTKTECLYIATKFNDEARAKLVLRWEFLERKEQERQQQLCLPSPKKILALADEIMCEGLKILNEPAEDTLAATQVAKTFNMSTLDFNAVLRDMGIQYRLFTIRAIISKWAPPMENKTEAYIANVSRLTGIGPDEPIGIPSDRPARWIMVGRAMAIQENGTESINDFAMLSGWDLSWTSQAS